MMGKIIIFFIGYFIGIISLVVICALKVGSDSERAFENQKKDYLDYGQQAYEELEKREKENGLSK